MATKAQTPLYAAHPGKLLKKELAARGLTQKVFAARIAMSEKNLSEVLNEKARLQPSMAYAMEQAFGMPASTWLNLQHNYDLVMEKNREQQELQRDCGLMSTVDYSAMSKRFPDQLPAVASAAEKVQHLRRFLNVSALQNLNSRERTATVLAGAYRLSGMRGNGVTELNYLNLVLWMHAGRVLAEQGEVGLFKRANLRKALPEVIAASRIPEPKQACREMVSILEAVAVRTAFVPYLKNTYANGVTQWEANGNPIITLSSRQGPYWDALLFSWFHEIGHILLHGKSYFSLSFSEETMMYGQDHEKEEEANRFAIECLLPCRAYDRFVQQRNFAPHNIRAFAEDCGVHPAVVIGRLAKHKELGWSNAIVSQRDKLCSGQYPFMEE